MKLMKRNPYWQPYDDIIPKTPPARESSEVVRMDVAIGAQALYLEGNSRNEADGGLEGAAAHHQATDGGALEDCRAA